MPPSQLRRTLRIACAAFVDDVQCWPRDWDDFARMLAEAETHENQVVEAYRKLAEEDDFAKQTKLTTVCGKQSEVQSLEVPLNHYSEDRVAEPAVKASKMSAIPITSSS